MKELKITIVGGGVIMFSTTQEGAPPRHHVLFAKFIMGYSIEVRNGYNLFCINLANTDAIEADYNKMIDGITGKEIQIGELMSLTIKAIE